MSTQVPLPHRDGQPPRPQRPRPRKPPPLGKGLLGTWKKPPKLDKKKFKVAKVGGGPRKGLYVAKRLKPKPAAAATPSAAAPFDPYAGNPDADLLRQYADQPWAQNIIRRIRGDQQHHESYVSDKVMPWTSAALTGLANIGSAANTAFTGQTTAVAAGLASAAGAQPGLYAGTSGGVVASPNAYQSAASAQAMAQNASTMGQIAQWQGLMGTLQQTTYSQGQIAALSDYAKGLPALYAERRAKAIDDIDKYIAEQAAEEAKLALQQAELEERQRSNRVNEAIRATNAETNAAIQFGRLGIDAAGEVRRGQPDDPTPVYDNVPQGFVQLPDGRVVRDPTYTAPGGDGGGNTPSAPPASGTPGNRPSGWHQEKGHVGGWKNRPSKKQIQNLVKRGIAKPGLMRSSDGRFYLKPGANAPGTSSGSGSGNTTGGKEARDIGTLTTELREKYHGKSSGPFGEDKPGWVDTFNKDPNKVANAVLSWVLVNRKSFTKPNGQFDVAAFKQVVGALGGPAGNNTMTRVYRMLRPRIDANGRLR